jgi:RNA polymerase sigma factor (sigma-70 family)
MEMKSARRDSPSQPLTQNGRFRTTQWTMVLQARDNSRPDAKEGLAKLCELYWPPIYSYLRRAGYAFADAKDLTQGFFAYLLENESLRRLDREKGKFRSFLLICLKNYLKNIRERGSAQKRGGGRTLISLDELKEGEREFEPSHGLTPEQIFETQWAEAVMKRAVDRLRQVYVDAGKMELFEQLKDLQPGERGEQSYAEIGMRLGLSEAAVKTAVHRMRVRHRALLRREIASTIGDNDDVEEELRYLREVLNR